MDLFQIMGELLRFLKDKKWGILIIALVLAGTVPTVRYLMSPYENEEQEAAYEDLNIRYQQEAASFQFIVKNEDGTLFTNSAIIDEYLSQRDVVQEIEKTTGLSFGQWIENEQLLGLNKTSQFRGGLGVIRTLSSDLMTMRVLVGKSLEENLAIAQAYYDLLSQNQVPLLGDKDVFMIHNVTDQELLSVDQYPYLTSTAALDGFTRLTPKKGLVLGVAAFIAGLLLASIGAIFLRLRDPKIRYAFDYAWSMDDHQIVIKPHERQKLISLLQAGHDRGAIILSQTPLQEVDSMDDYLKLRADQANEIIIHVKAGETDKSWFSHQYHMAKVIHIPIVIIQEN
ncbi:TPA: hypothetical protein ACGO1T_000696 [Streptococcus suis]